MKYYNNGKRRISISNVSIRGLKYVCGYQNDGKIRIRYWRRNKIDDLKNIKKSKLTHIFVIVKLTLGFECVDIKYMVGG